MSHTPCVYAANASRFVCVAYRRSVATVLGPCSTFSSSLVPLSPYHLDVCRLLPPLLRRHDGAGFGTLQEFLALYSDTIGRPANAICERLSPPSAATDVLSWYSSRIRASPRDE